MTSSALKCEVENNSHWRQQTWALSEYQEPGPVTSMMAPRGEIIYNDDGEMSCGVSAKKLALIN